MYINLCIVYCSFYCSVKYNVMIDHHDYVCQKRKHAKNISSFNGTQTSDLELQYWCSFLTKRRIFCDVNVIHLPSKTKCSEYWKKKIILSSPAILSLISQIMRTWHSFEKSKFYSVYMSSIRVLPPNLAASFENL